MKNIIIGLGGSIALMGIGLILFTTENVGGGFMIAIGLGTVLASIFKK